ncbi:MAG TPA: RDD family protein [Puia sp.]|jgi:uncharacterized RDD family membrane protein YckC
MENYINPSPQQDLLGDLAVNLQQASRGKRFANYLIDLVVFYVFMILVLGILATQGMTDLTDNRIIDRLITLICYGIFMGLYEGICKGKTLGKLITRTRAVNEDGSRISFKTGFLRGLSRAVPFEAFTAFSDPSYPWHDRWTHTYVIDETRSTLNP